MISLEKQDPEEYGLGIILSKMGDPMVIDDYPGLQATMIEIAGWGWLPVTAEEARRCLAEFLFDHWKYVVEVTVAGGAQKRVLITCAEGAHAWKVARALGPLLQDQLETFVSELSVHFVLDSDRVRYEFPIKKETLAAILEKQNAAATAGEASASAASSSGAAAVRAPQGLDQVVEYVRGLPEPERQQYFTKDGMREYSGLLELDSTDCRPHGMARFLLWDLVSREVKESGDQDTLQFITTELQDRVCYQAAMAEIWLQSVEQQLAPPSPEQWARFREMQPQAKQLALNVLTGAQVRRLKGELADR